MLVSSSMTDVVRKNAPDILGYFEEQGVDLKVISGDDPVTVAAIAARAGLKDADKYIDATTINTDEEMEDAVLKYSVFGRVTPKQKQQMVRLLKQNGRTVAMTGDGVNDVLALKDADVSIAMASGSEAAKNTANLVLLNSDFASLPHIVNEGRRVINNIKAAASMFLIKTGFSVLTALFDNHCWTELSVPADSAVSHQRMCSCNSNDAFAARTKLSEG